MTVIYRPQSLLHDDQVVGHDKGRTRLGFDLVHGDALGMLNQSQAIGKVDIKHGLQGKLC